MTTDSNRVQEHRESLLDLANRSSTPLRVITEAHGNSMLPQDSRSIRAHPYLDLPSPPPRVNELLERAEMLHSRLPIRRQWKARRETMYQMYRSMSVEYFDSIMSSRLPDYREAPRCVAPPQPLPTAPLEQTTPPIVTPTLHLPVLEVIAAEQRAHALADPTNVVAANVARMTRPQLEHFRIRTSSQSPGKTASPELATAQQQQQLAVGSRKRPAEPAELDESSRKRVGDITQIPRKAESFWGDFVLSLLVLTNSFWIYLTRELRVVFNVLSYPRPGQRGCEDALFLCAEGSRVCGRAKA